MQVVIELHEPVFDACLPSDKIFSLHTPIVLSLEQELANSLSVSIQGLCLQESLVGSRHSSSPSQGRFSCSDTKKKR
jgi:hypothetical protein